MTDETINASVLASLNFAFDLRRKQSERHNDDSGVYDIRARTLEHLIRKLEEIALLTRDEARAYCAEQTRVAIADATRQ